MIGVILWRDEQDDKAIIWCEDQGDLAYLDKLDDSTDASMPLAVGDVVRFNLRFEKNMRLAQDVERLRDNWGATLGDVLRMVPQDPSNVNASKGAEVVTFENRWLTDVPAQRAAGTA